MPKEWSNNDYELYIQVLKESKSLGIDGRVKGVRSSNIANKYQPKAIVPDSGIMILPMVHCLEA